jgi:hypothetical protein
VSASPCTTMGHMDPGTIIAGGAASPSAIGAFVAIWQAASASKQADRAEEQADAATVQAREAVRAAHAAEGQVEIARAQLRHMEAEAQARTVNEVRSNFSQFVGSIKLFVIACGQLEKQLRRPGEGEAIPELMQELVLANPIAHPSVMVLASHLPEDSPLISALNETNGGHQRILALLQRTNGCARAKRQDRRGKKSRQVPPTRQADCS